MKYKIVIPIILAGLFTVTSYAIADEELERVPESQCRLHITLDMPDLEPHAVQYAILDKDPILEYKTTVMWLRELYEQRLRDAPDEETGITWQHSLMRANWNDIFQEISGDKISLLTNTAAISLFELQRKYWIVTKVVWMHNEPICWAVPVAAEAGKLVEIVLNEDNVFDLAGACEEALAAVPVKDLPDPTFQDEAEAHALYNKMIDALENAETMYFESEYSMVTKGKTHSGQSYRGWLKKPDYARIEASKGGKHTGIIVGDGEQFWIYWPEGRNRFNDETMEEYQRTRLITYERTPYPPEGHSLAHMTIKIGMGMAVMQLSKFHGCHDRLDDYLDGVRSIGAEEIQGEICDIIEVSYMGNQRSKFFWLSRKDHLPRKLKEIRRFEYTLIMHELWSNVKTNIEVPDEKFNWQPPEHWVERRRPTHLKHLLDPGTEAPDFAFKTVNGDMFKLSDYRGTVVLINFWRVSCPPCREEIPFLEEIYKKHKDDGLVVVGFDTGDDKDIAMNLLRQHSVTYPNIIDNSSEAKDVQFYKYQNGGAAVPFNYIINREGKVADAWYGYDEGDTRALEVLKKLGIE